MRPDARIEPVPSLEFLAAADCERILVVRDRRADALAAIAVHDTSAGPAHGGIRRWRYPDLATGMADVVALARAMTWKCALAGLPAGGGKAVIFDRDGLDRRAAYRLVAGEVERLGGRFFTGPDVGTTAEDLREVAAVTQFVASPDPAGAGDLALATARGVLAAMRALARHLGCELAGLRVAVQGLGAVGAPLARLLHAAGARLVVADLDAARAAASAADCGAEVVPAERITAVPCDVFAPCALGGVIDEDLARRLPARAVCGAANNVFSGDAAARVLAARGVVAVPDFVANAGALIAGATFHRTGLPAPPERIDGIADTVAAVLARAAAAGRPPGEVALEIAQERLAEARRNPR